MSTSASSSSKFKVIDSHLHVWASKDEAATTFPYAEGQEPPETLSSSASTAALISQMDASGVDGALIVQPINHKFDHSYVSAALKNHPTRFKGMLLHDPSLASPDEAVSRLEELALQGFVGVRFNPYLWPKLDDDSWKPMSSCPAGLAVYKRCAELHMPVGVMCFQGLSLHYSDILALIKASPKTTLVLDHFGFTALGKDEEFQQLLDLSKFPNVFVKISALFRLGDEDTESYERVHRERFDVLLKKFGPERLLFGTDFPFCREQPPKYKGMVDLVSSWCCDETERRAIMGGTAESLFGAWGKE